MLDKQIAKMTIKDLKNKLLAIDQASDSPYSYWNIWATSSKKLILVWEAGVELKILGNFDLETGEVTVHLSSVPTAIKYIAQFLEYCGDSEEHKEYVKLRK